MANLKTKVDIKDNFHKSKYNYEIGSLVQADDYVNGDVGIIIAKGPITCEIYFFQNCIVDTGIELSTLSPFIGKVTLSNILQSY